MSTDVHRLCPIQTVKKIRNLKIKLHPHLLLSSFCQIKKAVQVENQTHFINIIILIAMMVNLSFILNTIIIIIIIKQNLI